ncbi:MAG TPA: branched-chain-amino-acid transaminase [Gemmatimonadales bacterium]|nr:branched-chain-amino-acid transaminase [Gemmatimonadales bacterium]
MSKIWLDGRFVEKDEAKISVFDHGLLYGDGVFEGIRAYNGTVFRLRRHVERLYASARAILLTIPMTPEEMCAMVNECLRVNGLGDAYIRLVVTRGFGDLGLDPRKCPRPTVFCIADSIALWPPDTYQRGLSVVTVPTPVNAPHNLSPQIKSLNYLAHILAKVEAINAGADESLMLEPSGTVAEGSGQNVFAVTDRTLRTPPGYAGILRGVTREAVIELAGQAGYQVQECVLNRYDLYTADEMFLTGTAAEIIGVTKLDGRPIGDGNVGPITRDLATRFSQLVRNST